MGIFMSDVWFILCYRITDEVVVACKLLNGHLYKGKEIGREQMVFTCNLLVNLLNCILWPVPAVALLVF